MAGEADGSGQRGETEALLLIGLAVGSSAASSFARQAPTSTSPKVEVPYRTLCDFEQVADQIRIGDQRDEHDRDPEGRVA